MAPITRVLIIINVLVFGLQYLFWEPALLNFALWPPGPRFEFWQVVTYAFLHGSVAHLFFNMFGVYMFGSELERYWGPRRFLILYFMSVLFAAATQMFVASRTGSPAPTVGASGGLFGLLLSYAVLFPRRKLMLIFPPIPMPAWLFVTLYGVLELILGLSGMQSGVAHFAHVGGILGGIVALMIFRARSGAREP